jgi:hypothetical protein
MSTKSKEPKPEILSESELKRYQRGHEMWYRIRRQFGHVLLDVQGDVMVMRGIREAAEQDPNVKPLWITVTDGKADITLPGEEF